MRRKATMTRAAVLLAIWISATACIAQTAGLAAARRAQFAAECGVNDISSESSLTFRQNAAGEWAVIGPDGTENDDLRLARVWHQGNWLLELRDVPGSAIRFIHTSELCFNDQGRIVRLIDHYMSVAQCGCMRLTTTTFAEDGHVTRHNQKFVSIAGGFEISEPESAAGFPKLWDYRRLDQLPFYTQLNKLEAK